MEETTMKANASNVLSYPNVECESTFDNQSPDIKYVTMTLEEFVAMPCIAFQRDVEQRSKRVAKLLKKKWLPTHGDVDAVVYPDGRHERINGNTRAYLWVDDDYGGPIPSHVQLTLYSVENEEEAKELYYTLDSQEAVEKTKDKLTGYFRALNLVFNTTRLARGGIVKSLEYASWNRPTQRDEDGSPLSTRQLGGFEAVVDFKEELEALDKIVFTGSNPAFNTTTISAMLMALKTYGPTNERLIEGLKRLKKQEQKASGPSTPTDGMTHILKEMANKKHFPNGLLTDGVSLPLQLDFFLYCFVKWMEYETFVQYKRPSPKNKRGRKSFYTNWWEA
jgi:hypothetical protein